MVAINTTPVRQGETNSTIYTGVATTTSTEYTFPSVQSTLFITNKGFQRMTVTISGVKSYVKPNQSVRFTADTDRFTIKSDYGTHSFQVEGRSNIGDASGVDLTSITADLAKKANGDVFRYKLGQDVTTFNVIQGYKDNDIISDVSASVILGSGNLHHENIIGGSTANVGSDTVSNVANLLGTGAHYAAILAGYDNVNNGLASIIAAMHSFIEKEATHGGILSGSYHKIIDGDYCNINGGTQNTVKGATSNASVISGGTYNTIDDSQTSVIGGGVQNDIKSSLYATVAGGSNNDITSSNGAVIVGGNNQVINGGGSSFIGSGTSNSITATFSAIIGGLTNSVTAQYASVLGGRENTATAMYSQVSGRQAKSYLSGQVVQADGAFSVVGDAQSSRLTLKQTVTTATGTLLVTQSGTAPIPQLNSVVAVKALVVAKRTDVVGEYAHFEIDALFARQANGTTITVGTPTITKVASNAGAEAWAMTIDASVAGGNMNIRFAGDASKTIRVVSTVTMTEVI